MSEPQNKRNLSPPPFREYKLFFMVNENKNFLKNAMNMYVCLRRIIKTQKLINLN